MSDVESGGASRSGELQEIRESGVVAGHDVHMTGHLVAGRDVHYHAAAAGAARPPSQLPPDIADFTGREPEVRAVQSILERPRRHRDTAVRVSAIAGRAGVGKTALATHVAHLVRRRFPDGQLYVDLGGVEGHRLEPVDVLDRFLRALGVDGTAVPPTLEERRDLFRTHVADRQVLVLLDNAAGAAQVQPLLPSSAGSAALVTSRMPLTGLEGAQPVRLDVLGVDQAVELLSKVAGPGRVTDDDLDEARLIVELCDRLPLAVRIAGAKLQARAHWSLEMLAERLIDEYTRLNELKIRDLEVRASFALTYEHLEERERRAFRLLSLVKAPDFPAWVAAALLNTGLRQAEDLLDSLVEAQVLEVARRPQRRTQQTAVNLHRYRFHDLLRIFARDRRWAEESPAAQEAALERALDAYLALAGHAAALLEPGVETPSRRSAWVRTTAASVADLVAADPGAWFATEWVNLLGVVQEAHDNGVFDLTWELAGNLTHFCWLRNHWSDWERTQLLALDASRRAAKRDWEADTLRQLGAVYQELEDWSRAADHLGRSLSMAEDLGDDRLIGWALLKLADLSTEQNDYDQAVGYLRRCMAIFRRTRDARGQAWARFQRAVVDRYQGRYGEAVDAFEKVLRDFTAMRDRSGEAFTLLNLGIIEHARGEVGRAHEHLAACLPIFDQLGDRRSAAYTLGHIGIVHHDIGIAEGDRQRSREGIAYLRLGLGKFRQLRLRDGEAWTLLNIGVVYRDQGQHKEAAACFDRCLEICRALEDDQLAARANVAMGDLLERQGLFGKATTAYDRAAPVLHTKEDRLWEARLLRGRGLVAAKQGETRAAAAAWNQSADLYRSLGAPAELEVSRLLAGLGNRDHQSQS